MASLDDSRLKVTCRPAREADTADMLELTSTIWEGHDYVPQVWAEWLADPHGRLLVAEYQDEQEQRRRVVGFGRLERQTPTDWWLQGLRVHPQFERRGIASQIQAALLQVFDEMGAGVLRLWTTSARPAVHRLCEKDGFEKIGELAIFQAPLLAADASAFTLLGTGEASRAIDFLRQSPSLALSCGLLDIGWEYVSPASAELLEDPIRRQRAWWWQGGRGLLGVYDDEDDTKALTPMIAFLGCRLEDLAALLQDYRRLASALGYSRAGWAAPLDPFLLPILEQQGFTRTWDEDIYVYARKHRQPAATRAGPPG